MVLGLTKQEVTPQVQTIRSHFPIIPEVPILQNGTLAASQVTSEEGFEELSICKHGLVEGTLRKLTCFQTDTYNAMGNKVLNESHSVAGNPEFQQRPLSSNSTS